MMEQCSIKTSQTPTSERPAMACPPSQTQLDETAVENFREYLRIPSVQPDVNYDDCVAFLKKQAKSLDLPVQVYEHNKGKPVVIFTWVGTEPAEKSILLNSHMDVVPVFEDKWTYPPFDAHMDEAGNIYARGSQDMKCVGIQYLEAIRRMKLQNERVKRTIHVSFVPDEEIGGALGMGSFVQTEEFKSLNVGFALDEAAACPANAFYLANGERAGWNVVVHCPGDAGHGSVMLPNNAGEKIRVIIDRFMDLRAKESAKLLTGQFQIGDVISVNLTKLSGGVQTNVIPEELVAVFDMRLPPSADYDEIEEMLNGWCKEAGKGVHVEFEQKSPKIESTKLDETNPFWLAFKATCDEMGMHLVIGTLPGATDSRFVRSAGIPAICFSPMNNTKILLHDHDEYLNKDVFLQGIKIYMKLLPAVSNV